MRQWLTGMMAALLGGCVWAPPMHNPMPSVPAQSEKQSDTLVVMLPGRGSRAEDYRRHGFFETGKDRGFDMIAADAHFRYYYERVIVERLHEDIVRPAVDRGYTNIWLLGISMGGMGAKLYAQEHPELVDGLILLAPYPGDADLVKEIGNAGLDRWDGESEHGEPYQLETWRWLRDVTKRPGSPTIVLGYGKQDRFAAVGELLDDRIPERLHFTAPGGHKWPVWKALWRDMLEAEIPVVKQAEYTAAAPPPP